MSGTINRARGAGDSPCQNCSQHFRILVNGCRPLRGLVSFICLGPGVSLAALASPQALCWRALRALLVNVSECVKYIISNSEVQLLSFAAARRGPQLRFRPAVSSKKQRASSAFVLTARGKYTYVFPSSFPYSGASLNVFILAA